MAKILDGKWLASCVQQEIRRKVEEKIAEGHRAPGLGVILVGDNQASRAYVANKERVAKKRCGFETFDFFLPEDASLTQVEEAIDALNVDERVDGLLLQLPLPKHLSANALIDRIDPQKDADGLHPVNQGLMLRGEGRVLPCTPLGVMLLIDLAFSGVEMGGELGLNQLERVDLSGLTAVVIGRSILVGKPLATLLLERNATVIQAHSRTKDLSELCSKADILVAAVGVSELVRGDWVKPKAVVIDVGINRREDSSLVGDVAFQEVESRCSAITPVPGGVGPMTVAMLMRNTLRNYSITRATGVIE